MASTTLGDQSDYTTQAAVEEKAKLQRHFGRFDMLFFLLCTLVGLDTLGAVSTNGAQAFTWLAFLGIFFFVPYALLTAELGSTFTEEGGQYVWTRMAFGRLVAAVNSVIYWVANPIWLGGLLTITAVSVFSTFYTPLTGFWKYAFAIAFIWFAVVAAILSFGIGKWIPTIGAIGRIALLSFFTLSVIIYGFKHGIHGFGASAFKPTYTVFIAAVPTWASSFRTRPGTR
jgi:glutamate:GABA antiporter